MVKPLVLSSSQIGYPLYSFCKLQDRLDKENGTFLRIFYTGSYGLNADVMPGKYWESEH